MPAAQINWLVICENGKCALEHPLAAHEMSAADMQGPNCHGKDSLSMGRVKKIYAEGKMSGTSHISHIFLAMFPLYPLLCIVCRPDKECSEF